MYNLEKKEIVLNKYCNELNSDDKRQRKRALDNIRKDILNVCVDNNGVANVFEIIKKHLYRCFKDPTEAVRESAVNTVIYILSKIPAKEDYISSLMPIISERLSDDLTLENSEEVRLCLVMLTGLLIRQYKDHLFHYLDSFINIYIKTIVDPYPKVKKESCNCAAELAKSLPQHFHMQSESLINPLIQAISHQQYRVRVAGILSIGYVVRHGKNESVNDVCGPLAERLFDQHHAVRAAVASVVGMWLVELPDRYSYFHKLIPLMLTTLTEEIPEQRQEAELLWSKVGEQFMKENENDLKEKMDYLQEKLDHYPPNVVRPNLGCRTLVQRELSKYLPAIEMELDDWKDDVRVKSAQLLCVTVQHAESCITQHLERALPSLYIACGDSDPRVVENIERAAEMVGYFVLPDVYWRLMRNTISEGSNPGPLRVLAAVLRTSQAEGVKPQLESIADTLATDQVCHNRQPAYQQQLVNVVSAVQFLMQQGLTDVSQQLFTVSLSLLGLSSEPVISKEAKALLNELAGLNGITLPELYSRHTPAVLDTIEASVPQWSLLAPQRFVFEAVLTNAGSAVGQNMKAVLTVLEAGLKPETEPEATLQTLMALVYVLTHSEETLSEVMQPTEFVLDLCTRILSPQLVWRAGRSAEALRTAGMSCVVAALDVAPCTRPLADTLRPVLLGLVEDSAVKTRQLALLSLLGIVRALKDASILTALDIETMFVVVLKRLDDNNDRVRETAVRVLCELFHSPWPADFSVESHEAIFQSLYDTMLLHLDDPEPPFQDIMLDALKKVSAAHPQLLQSRINTDNYRNKDKCEQLIAYLKGLKL